jgi:fructosamine-3-kinase
MWAEVDLAHVWTTSPPPEAQRFFEVYADLTALDGDWRARMPIVQLRQHLAVLAQFDEPHFFLQPQRANLGADRILAQALLQRR